MLQLDGHDDKYSLTNREFEEERLAIVMSGLTVASFGSHVPIDRLPETRLLLHRARKDWHQSHTALGLVVSQSTSKQLRDAIRREDPSSHPTNRPHPVLRFLKSSLDPQFGPSVVIFGLVLMR